MTPLSPDKYCHIIKSDYCFSSFIVHMYCRLPSHCTAKCLFFTLWGFSGETWLFKDMQETSDVYAVWAETAWWKVCLKHCEGSTCRDTSAGRRRRGRRRFEDDSERFLTLWRCQGFWSAPQQNKITLSLFFCFPWRDNRDAEGVHVQCPLSAARTPHSSNWCFVRPRLASLEPSEPAGRNKSNMSSALRSAPTVCQSVFISAEVCTPCSETFHISELHSQ